MLRRRPPPHANADGGGAEADVETAFGPFVFVCLAQTLGFGTAFVGLAVVAGLGLGAVWWLMPETVDAARAEE